MEIIQVIILTIAIFTVALTGWTYLNISCSKETDDDIFTRILCGIAGVACIGASEILCMIIFIV